MIKLRKILIILSTLLLTISCTKDFDGSELEKKEMDLLDRYIEEFNITTEPTASGLYFIELDEGTGNQASRYDYVLITFTGKLINGVLFDCSDEELALNNSIYSNEILYGPYKFYVDSSIPGISEGISMMQEGDSAQLIIPSSLGFGALSSGTIPSYATLIYNIRLEKVISNPISYETQLLNDYISENQITTVAQSSGLYFIEDSVGTGDVPEEGDKIKINYKVSLLDGRIIEASGDYPTQFVYNSYELILGLSEGISLIKEGGKATLLIPYNLAYGAKGRITSGYKNIPPYSTLVYEFELVEIIE